MNINKQQRVWQHVLCASYIFYLGFIFLTAACSGEEPHKALKVSNQVLKQSSPLDAR